MASAIMCSGTALCATVFPVFDADLFRFLRELARHNERRWFLGNKARYEMTVREPMLGFIRAFAPRLRTISRYFVADPRPVGGSMMRIYRDLRFSKDKTPYRTSAAAHFSHADADEQPAPGFYLHLEPGRSFVGCGLWHPDAASLRSLRNAIVAQPPRWRRAMRGLKLEGGSLARPPRGYDPDHALMADLKRTDFIVSARFGDRTVCAPGFLGRFTRECRRAAPLMRFLTTSLGLPF